MGSTFVANSPAITRLLKLARVYAISSYPVLLTGESGTGKTALARWLHAHSPRREKPFVELDAGLLEDGLAGSTLFGHVRGAYTSAQWDREGAFRLARGGTLFLDEVGRLSLAVQGALLKAIDEGIVKPLGSDKTEIVDVRVIAATNRDLWAAAAHGAFAEDLLYRLAVLTLNLPPLRERPEDLRPLTEMILASRPSSITFGLDEAAISRLAAYHFPGNVRELEGILEECCLLAQASDARSDAIGKDHFISEEVVQEVLSRRLGADSADGPAVTLSAKEERIRRQAVVEAFRRHRGNKTAMAAELGVSRQTVSKWIRHLGIE